MTAKYGQTKIARMQQMNLLHLETGIDVYFHQGNTIGVVPLPNCHMNCKDSLTIYYCWPECSLLSVT